MMPASSVDLERDPGGPDTAAKIGDAKKFCCYATMKAARTLTGWPINQAASEGKGIGQTKTARS